MQISLTPDAMERLLPVAEKYGVTLALEVHADQYGAHPRVLALRDRYEKLGSPLLGFTADWGATVTGFAPSLLEAYRRRGASEDLLRQVVDLWNGFYATGPPTNQKVHGERFGAFIGLAARNGRPDLGIDFGINGTGLFGPAPLDNWLEIMPWIRHVHGKFFGIDENGEEPSVPVRDLVRQLVENGYSGAISSEYEGWHWNHWENPFEIIRAEQAVQRSAAASRRLAHADRHRTRRAVPSSSTSPARPPLNRTTPRSIYHDQKPASPAPTSSSASPSTHSPPNGRPDSTPSRASSRRSPTAGWDPVSSSTVRRCCAPIPTSTTTSCGCGTRRSTGWAWSPAPSARTSTWVAARTVT